MFSYFKRQLRLVPQSPLDKPWREAAAIHVARLVVFLVVSVVLGVAATVLVLGLSWL